MFLGHIAAGFAAKPFVPRVSLGWLVAAGSLLDWLWPVFLLLGWERVAIDPGNTAVTPLNFASYPISHSLLMTLLWSLLVAGVTWLLGRDLLTTVVLGLLVASHWLLDALVHRPDLPVTLTGSLRVGWGLWNSLPGTIAVEGLIFAFAIGWYRGTTTPVDRVGRWSLLALVATLILIYLGNLYGPPPPSWQAVAWIGLATPLFALWAAWIDRHRTAR